MIETLLLRKMNPVEEADKLEKKERTVQAGEGNGGRGGKRTIGNVVLKGSQVAMG